MKQYAPEGKALIFFLIAASQLAALEAAAREAGRRSHLLRRLSGLRTRPLLSDYTWNHTTLWAMRSDEAYTYLQCGFDPATVREQMRRLKERFGNEILFHMEFMEGRRRAHDSRRDSGGLLHHRGALERNDRLLPRDRRLRRESACEQRRRRRALSRGQRATARQAALRPEGLAESGQNDHFHRIRHER